MEFLSTLQTENSKAPECEVQKYSKVPNHRTEQREEKTVGMPKGESYLKLKFHRKKILDALP